MSKEQAAVVEGGGGELRGGKEAIILRGRKRGWWIQLAAGVLLFPSPLQRW